MLIRKAHAADVTSVANLHVRVWQDAYRGHMPDSYLDALEPARRAEMWSQVLREPSKLVLVAYRESSLVGFCLLQPSRDAEAPLHVGEIAALYVDAASWRSGYGTALLEGAVRFAADRHMRELTLWVLGANARACSFYEARGFARDGRTKTDERQGFPLFEVRYRRTLGSSEPR